MKLQNIIGQKFGRLTVLENAGKDKSKKHRYLLCRCECGNETRVFMDNLIKGNTKSCGCLHKERARETKLTHGMQKSLEYGVWQAMKSRCLNKNNKNYNNWGGRGIKVCNSWLKFENFYKDMGKKPEGLTLDRIDNNSGYSKENCRWVTSKENNRNRRDNVMITYKGETLCRAEWAEKLGIKYDTLKRRFYLGWSIERAFNNLTTKQYA